MRLLAVLTALCGLTGGLCGTSNLTVTKGDVLLEGGASFIPGHGAPTGHCSLQNALDTVPLHRSVVLRPLIPTGLSLRTGSPGQTTAASFPSSMVLAPGMLPALF